MSSLCLIAAQTPDTLPVSVVADGISAGLTVFTATFLTLIGFALCLLTQLVRSRVDASELDDEA